MPAPKSRYATMVTIAALCLARLWLAVALPLRAMGSATLDDRLFIRMAASLLEGRWLGPYDHEILTVGPFYAILVALTHLVGVPLLLCHQFLYVFACTMLFLALRGFLPSTPARLAVFAILLFAPFSFDYEATRVIRDNVYMSLTLLVLAGFLSLMGSSSFGVRLRWICVAGSGLALSAFWLTREEGLWIVPTLAILLAYSAIETWRHSGVRRAARVAALFVPIAMCAAAVFAAALTNYLRYDVFHIIEQRDPGFEAASGALLRVRHQTPNRFAQVPQETRLRIYAVSPTFALLKPYLEGSYGRRWGEIAESNLTEGTPNPADIRGSWFLWGLRRGVSDLGYAKTASEAHDFYQRVADEVNAACSAGTLECGPKRSSTMLPWQPSYIPLLARCAGKVAWRLATLDELRYPIDRVDPYRDVDERDWEAFANMTRRRLLRADAMAAQSNPGAQPYRWRLEAIRVIRDFYPYLMLPLCLAGAAAFVLNSAAEVRGRRFSACTAISTALLLGIAARTGILSYLAVTSFDSLEPRYLMPLYPMAILLSSLSLWQFRQKIAAPRVGASAESTQNRAGTRSALS